MEFNASRQSFITSAVACIALAGVVTARYVIAPWAIEAPSTGGMPLAAAAVRMSALVPWLGWVIAATLTVWTLSLVVRMAVRYAPQMSRNYIPPQMFLILAVGIVVPSQLVASLAAEWLVAVAMRRFGGSLRKGYSFSDLFVAGFCLGLVPLFYAPGVVVAAVAIPSALILFKRSGREAVVTLAGFALPVPAAGFIHWASGREADFIYRELWRCCTSDGGAAFARGVPLAPLVLVVVVTAFLLVAASGTSELKKTIRKTPYKFMLFTWMMTGAALVSGFIPGTSTTLLAIVAPAASLTSTYAFSGRLTTAASVLYLASVAVALTLGILGIVGVALP